MQKTNQPDMFYSAKPIIFERAKQLRKNMTKSEMLIWNRLNKNQLGVRFKSQHPIDIFIVDFYCHKLKLVIEIDGEIHNRTEDYDIGRTAELERFGIKLIRFSNDEIKQNIDEVIEKIKQEVLHLSTL